MSIEDMKKRIQYAGGTQDGRNVKAKFNSFKAALGNSYQAEWIIHNNKKWRCLINPEKMTTDYDQKLISIEHASKMKPGDVFFWNRTGKHWIVYNEQEEEEAYFRARIRRCDYQISTDKETYWIWLRGTVETVLVWKQKHQIESNELNYSLELYITKNDDTNEFFTRHRMVKFDNHNWKVAAVDRYSQEGIIQVFLEESYDNEMLDEMLPIEIIKPDTSVPHIEGPQLVKPYDTDLCFSIVGASGGSFVVNSNKVKITSADDSLCVIDIITGKSGKFDLSYIDSNGNNISTLNIVIESL